MANIITDLQASQDETTGAAPTTSSTPVAKIGRKAGNRGTAASGKSVQPAHRPPDSKTEIILKKLRLARGATIPTLSEATSWQAHSVRGFISGTVKKKLGLTVISELGKDGVRRYRIDDSGKSA